MSLREDVVAFVVDLVELSHAVVHVRTEFSEESLAVLFGRLAVVEVLVGVEVELGVRVARMQILAVSPREIFLNVAAVAFDVVLIALLDVERRYEGVQVALGQRFDEGLALRVFHLFGIFCIFHLIVQIYPYPLYTDA